MALLLFFALTRLLLIGLSDLKFEEAYYWDYSQHPSLSYFDHPPMVAWLIGLSTRWLGHNSFAVRLPAVLMFLGGSALLAKLCDQLFGSRAACWTVLLLNSIPALTMHALFILPDNPLFFFWSLGLYAGWQLISREDTRWWWLVGLATGLGMDSKYPALLIPLGIFLHCFTTGRRRLVLNFSMLGAAALALALFAPVIVWNVQHDFASFRFQGGERMHEAVSLSEKMGSWLFQFGLLSPVAFVAMFVALHWAWKRRRLPEIGYLLCWCLPFLLLMVYVSCRRLVQINWPMPGYIATLLLMGAWLDTLCSYAWLVSILTTAFLLSTVWWLPLIFPIASLNRVDDVTQWAAFGEQAASFRLAMPNPARTFLAGNGYQAAAELAYTSNLPLLTLSNNILGGPNKGFTYWADPQDFAGWDAIYANYAQPTSSGGWRERVELDQEKLKSCFERVQGPETLVIDRGGKPLRRYQYFRCFGYKPPT